ncbi:hypothetical protein DFH28DRAFT_1177266 [Melampsora americana]|nr:hypothetical protein DFH28DRAFT_1177266 [Melampsora americana]
MLQLKDRQNVDETMVRGSQVAEKMPEKQHDQLTKEELALDDDDANVRDENGSDPPRFSLSEGTGVGLTKPLIKPIADKTNTPVGLRLFPPSATSPSPPFKPTNVKQPAPFSPKPCLHQKKVDHLSSADALMALEMVIKDKLAPKEADQKEDMKIRNECQAKLDKMHID